MKRHYLLLILAVVMAGCGGGGGDSGPKHPGTSGQVTKQSRPPLLVEDAVATFDGVGRVTQAQLDNVRGTVTYQILDSTPANVIQVSDSGELQILRPGTATLRASDTSSVYESSEATFTITVEKGLNPDLAVSELHFNATESDGQALAVRGQKGQLSYQVASGSEHLIRVDSDGVVYPVGPTGQATVIIADSGNEYYQPSQIRVGVHLYAVGAEQLRFALLQSEYRDGLTLEPVRLDTAETQSIRYQIIHSTPDDQVAEMLNPDTGLILIHNVGQATVEATATYGEGFLQPQQSARFVLDVTPGKRQALSVENITTSYLEDGVLHPKVSHALGTLAYQIISGEDVIVPSDDGQALRIKAIGAAEVEVSEHDLRNYPTGKARFRVEVERAPHPAMSAVALTMTYRPDLRIPLQFAGQKGDVSVVGSLPDGLRLVADELAVEQAGDYLIRLTDDGGDFYQPMEFDVHLQIAKAQGLPLPTRDYEQVYSKDYQFNLLRDFGLLATGDHIDVVSNSDPEVADAIADGLVHVYKAGETTLTLRRAESTNYSAGPEQKVRFNILSAPSRIEIQSDVEETWHALQPLLAKPIISGTVGEVTYQFADGAATDVVSLDRHSGEMHILNAGSTRIVVSDAGDDKFTPGESSFAVTILPADNPLSVTYPGVTYAAGATITPIVTDGEVQTSYHLVNQVTPVVELESAESGVLSVLHAGDYQLEVTLSARNYTSKTVTVSGTINKAEHPGLSGNISAVDFEPFKTISLDFGSAKGTRHYQLADSLSKQLATLDNAQGTITLQDYVPGQSIGLNVSESESRDYQALPETLVRVPLKLAESGAADQYTLLDSAQTVVVSTLSAPQFAKLQESEFGLMGARNVREPTDTELNTYGKGKVALLQVKPVGDDDTTKVRGIWMHIARFDGCMAELSEDATDPFLAVDFTAPGYCDTGSTIRMTRFLVIDDSGLEEGRYELTSPLIYYRRGVREFLASDRGGFYADPDVTYGDSKYGRPKSLYEWAVVQLNYQH
ncbi:cadherin repeat domain-containing protein [Vibrio sp. CAU 1672]|uniref:cadherin repeat domain-containing protein n=1 Tax=Vibrio sp. CAU 1672 TaxID=3032594 RepID=UPI0023DC86A0|nr:cadherin repeat domain-containing protein [Vibrio sp. CAU 1672]MDF2153603.1 cadherin repeat domain-containing protein [Vibrio sp. CAU 1672]